MPGSSSNDCAILFAIADVAITFSPIHLSGVHGQIRPCDVVVCSDFSAAQAAKEAHSLVRATIRRAVGLAVMEK